MASKTDKYRTLWSMYRKAGNKMPVSKRALAEWAFKMGYYTPEPEDVVDHLANELGEFLRQDHHIDSKGRKVRSNVAVPTLSGIEWGDYTLPRAQIEAGLKYKRRLIVGDCWQLKADTDSYNEAHPSEPQIKIPFDFNPDMTELERERQIEQRKGKSRRRLFRDSRQDQQRPFSSNAH